VATIGVRLARGGAKWLALGACSLLVLSVSCGSSDATASNVDDGGTAGAVGIAGSGGAGSGGSGSAGTNAGQAGASGGSEAPDASAGLTLCSTTIGPCKFDSAAQCPATQPAAGSSCGAAALVCYYCPVSAFSVAVSSCSNGSWRNTRASCGS